MIYKVEKIIKNDISNEEFIELCRKDFKKTLFIGLSSMFGIIVIFILTFCVNYYNFKSLIFFLNLLSVLCCFPFMLMFSIIFGNMHGCGIIADYSRCKTIADWIHFAENRTSIQKNIILSKKLAFENNDIVDVCFTSNELRCINKETSNIQILQLKEPFYKEFNCLKNRQLRYGKVVLDLTKDLTAYFN